MKSSVVGPVYHIVSKALLVSSAGVFGNFVSSDWLRRGVGSFGPLLTRGVYHIPVQQYGYTGYIATGSRFWTDSLVSATDFLLTDCWSVSQDFLCRPTALCTIGY